MVNVLSVLVIVLASCAVAHAQAVERNAKGPANKDIRVGLYVNVQPDCTSGPLPTIRLATAPQNGKVTVKQGRVKATNYKQCLALEVPAYIALYRSAAGFSGSDTLELEVKYPNGRSEIQKITVQVTPETPGQKI